MKGDELLETIQWHECSDRMPEVEFEEYLCFGKGLVSTLELREYKWWSDVLSRFIPSESITHLAHLPDGPRDEHNNYK